MFLKKIQREKNCWVPLHRQFIYKHGENHKKLLHFLHVRLPIQIRFFFFNEIRKLHSFRRASYVWRRPPVQFFHSDETVVRIR